MKTKIMLVYGGRSGEHEISLRSAASVLAHLDHNKYTVLPVGIDKQGNFFLNTLEDLIPITESLPVKTKNSKPLPCIMAFGRAALEIDVVLPIVHGPLYEDGCLQGIFRLMNVAFVGSDVMASAIAMDKDMTRKVACKGEIIAPRYEVLSIHSSLDDREQFCNQLLKDMHFPLFVKPCCLGSSVGINKVQSKSELISAINEAFQYDDQVLIEQGIIGREIELAVLGDSLTKEKPEVTVPGEIKVHHKDGFYSYDAKYIESTSSELIIPAKVTKEQQVKLQQYAVKIFTSLKCHGLARVDFFVDDLNNKIYFNEINVLPGFTSISMYPMLWQASGLGYSVLLDKLIDLAILRHKIRSGLLTSYTK